MPGADAARLLAESGRFTITAGLTDHEFRGVEERFTLHFSDQHRAFLSTGLPVGLGWPDWRGGDEMALRLQIGRPLRDVVAAARCGTQWGQGWGPRPSGGAAAGYEANDRVRDTRCIPLYGALFLVVGDDHPDVVWQVDDAGVRAYADDLREFVKRLCGLPGGTGPAQRQPTMFGLAALVPETWPELTVPPFEPDRVVPMQTSRQAGDPIEVLTEIGLGWSEVTRHDGILSDGGAVFSVKVDFQRGVALWESVYALAPRTGWWPVLVGERF